MKHSFDTPIVVNIVLREVRKYTYGHTYIHAVSIYDITLAIVTSRPSLFKFNFNFCSL